MFVISWHVYPFKPFQPGLMLDYDHSLLKNIRQGFKILIRTNVLAYFRSFVSYEGKYFITLVPGVVDILDEGVVLLPESHFELVWLINKQCFIFCSSLDDKYLALIGPYQKPEAVFLIACNPSMKEL